MRVNIEDDLWTSGRLSKLARSLKWDEGKALGALVNVYRLTQMARLSEEKASRVATVIVIAFDSDEEADAFITAMIAAQLACVTEDGNVRIRGNKRRIEELDEWYDKSVRGGKARAASGSRNGSGRYEKPNDQSRQTPAKHQADTSQAPGVLSPMSLVSPPTEERNEKQQAPKIDRAMLSLHYGTYRQLLKTIRNKTAPPTATGKDKFALSAICEAALGDTGKVLEAFIRDSNPHYEKNGWPLRVLEDDLGKFYQRIKANPLSAAERAAQQQASNQAQLEEFL